MLGAVQELEKRRPGNRWGSYYPWASWFAKKRFTLHHGEQYDCTPGSMITGIRVQAKKHGVRVGIDLEWQTGKITVTVKGPLED